MELHEYMSGGPLPVEEKKPKPTKVPVVRYYGVFLNSKGRLIQFHCREEYSVPFRTVVMAKTICLGEEINKIALDFRDEYWNNYMRGGLRFVVTNRDCGYEIDGTEAALRDLSGEPKVESPNTIRPGSIVVCADSQGHHIGVVLDASEEDVWLLFCTSNPYWNPKSRKLTTEELSLLGFPKRSRTTYFAPVYQPRNVMSLMEHTFPQHRVEELLKEFRKNVNVHK